MYVPAQMYVNLPVHNNRLKTNTLEISLRTCKITHKNNNNKNKYFKLYTYNKLYFIHADQVLL